MRDGWKLGCSFDAIVVEFMAEAIVGAYQFIVSIKIENVCTINAISKLENKTKAGLALFS